MRLLLIVWLASAVAAEAQVYMSGHTRDSVSLEIVPFVTIHTPAGKMLASSNDNGYFSLSCSAGDTIVFTRLGYKPLMFAPEKTNWDLNVLLSETVRVLQNVTIYDNYRIHGHDQIQESIKDEGPIPGSIQNQTQNPANPNMIQTFGPGMVINGLFSRLAGVGKEQRKLNGNLAELARTQTYREVLGSPQVRQFLIGQFAITDDEYLKRLERFKVSYPTARYLSLRQEIINLMITSFASR